MIAVLVCATVGANSLSAQVDATGPGAVHIPTEDDVVAATMAPTSPYFYLPMMARYMEGDTSLTDAHYFYLYYGYAYEAEFDAHDDLPGEAVISEIFARTDRPDREDALALIEAGRQNMTVDPFSPSNLNMMTFAYELVGDTEGARVSDHRFRGVVRAITSSGTGVREKSPWHILRFSHAEDIMAARGLTVAERTVRTRTVEYLQAEPNPAGVKGYFFDFERVYWKPFEGERVEREHRWLFNGFPI
ncbi:MAG: DUF4919 domain-containing protein [Alistipes sp.]|jgi:hypothetical protein|nr:DUF4919 domain-containing protein [Alistipes sp.]